MSEHDTEQATPGISLTRGTFLKDSATTAAAALGAGALTSVVAPTIAAAARPPLFRTLGSAQSTVTVALGFSGPAAIPPFLKSVSDFEASHPTIKINAVAIPATSWANLFEIITTRIAAGNAPDVFSIASEGVGVLGSKNLIIPVTDFLRKDPAFEHDVRGDTVPVMFQALSYKGKQLAVPTNWNSMFVWYNTAIFRQLGIPRPKEDWTGDDFLAICATIRKHGPYAVSLWASGTFGIEAWSLAAGGNLINGDWTRSTALDKPNQVAWQFLYDLVWKYKYAPKPPAQDVPLFEAGRVAMILFGRWDLATFQADKFHDYDFIRFPILNGGPRRNVFGIGGWTILKSAKDPDAAFEVVKYLSSRQRLRQYAQAGNDVPARRSVAYDASVMSPPARYRLFYDVIAQGSAVSVTAPPQYNELDTALTRWYSKMMANQISPAAALAGLNKDQASILAQSV